MSRCRVFLQAELTRMGRRFANCDHVLASDSAEKARLDKFVIEAANNEDLLFTAPPPLFDA